MSIEVHPPQIINGYELMGEIGRGAAGTVRLAKRSQSHSNPSISNEVCCCKIISKQSMINEKEKKFFQTEISVLSQISHPNIVSFIELFEDANNYYIFQEYCDGISLTNYIMRKSRLLEGEAIKLFFQLLQALNYLHQNNIAHRDIKLENIMLVEDDSNLSLSSYQRQSTPNLLSRTFKPKTPRDDKSYKIKLIDFGLSTDQSQNHRQTFCGSPLYAAPECLKSEPYDATKSDIWSAGVVFYIMVVGNFPWDPSNVTKMVNFIVKCEYRVPSFISQQCLRILQKVLIADPNKRPTAQQLISDPDLALLMPVTLRHQPIRRSIVKPHQNDSTKRIPLQERKCPNLSINDNMHQKIPNMKLEGTSNFGRRMNMPLVTAPGTPRVLPPKIPLHKSRSFNHCQSRRVHLTD